MTFTQNQTRQLYVVKNIVDDVDNLQHPGDIFIGQTHDDNNKIIDLWFNYVGPNGRIQRTDLIQGGMNTPVSFQYTEAEDQRRPAIGYVITLNNNLLVNSSNIINGQDYLVNIRIQQYYIKSDLHYEWKHGVVHGAGNMSASDFYAKMALSLYGNFCREPWPILKFGVTTSTISDPKSYNMTSDKNNITWITQGMKFEDLIGTYTGIVVTEEPQDWHLGKMSQEPVIYDVHCDYIVYSGEEMLWGDATKCVGYNALVNGNYFPHNTIIADMEWFYHGERGDIYREYAYPSNIDFIAMADPSKEYNTLDIHYYWQGANHAIQKSEKDITLIAEDGANAPDLDGDIKDVIEGWLDQGWSNE